MHPTLTADEVEEPGEQAQVATALAAGLQFLHRHQDAEGGWRVATASASCTLAGPRIAPPTGYADWRADVVVSSLALRCFLQAGHQPGVGPYGRTVARAQEWLLAQAEEVMETPQVFVKAAWLDTLSLIDHPQAAEWCRQVVTRLHAEALRHPEHDLAMGWFFIVHPTRGDLVDLPATAWVARALTRWPDCAAAQELRRDLAQGAEYLWFPDDDPAEIPHRVRVRDDEILHLRRPAPGYGLSLMHALGDAAPAPRLTALAQRVRDGGEGITNKFSIHDAGLDPFALHSVVHGMGVLPDDAQRQTWRGDLQGSLIDVQEQGPGCPTGSWNTNSLAGYRGRVIGDMLTTVLVMDLLQRLQEWDD